MDASDESTQKGVGDGVGRRSMERLEADNALVVAWCARESERIGEVARLRDDGPRVVLGRGAPRPEDGCSRVRFYRERPFALEETPPLSGPAISRRQLVFAPRHAAIDFERIGACPVLQNGERRDRGVLRPGDTLALAGELVLHFVRRAPLRALDAPVLASRALEFGRADRDAFVGESEAMWRIRAETASVATAAGHVLILGASGVGKELVASAIHRMSARVEGPFLARSAASFPAALVDAELFGNMRNYPNPGMAERAGLFGSADGGTLFLDEIGELAGELQSHLLRVLDSAGEYHRLGEAMPRRSNVRLLAATNRGVDALKGDFAARFALRLQVPDLNERKEDVPLLVRHLLERARSEAPSVVARFFDESGGPRITSSFIEHLLRRTYAYNVRELGEILWRSVRGSRGDSLEAVEVCASAQDAQPLSISIDRALPSEREVREALVRHRGSASRASRHLGLSSRYVIYRLMRKYRIPVGEGESA